jgi:SAM-dependent methyltransferase
METAMNRVSSTLPHAETGGYVFPNTDAIAEERLSLLAQLFDPASRACLTSIGVMPGWRCWEVGAGCGTIARWLHTRVGADGHVLATDLEPRLIEPLACSGLQVMQHDVVRDPLPAQKFDLIHTRLLLCHLPERDQVLDRLACALKPGGWLVVEDFDALSMLPEPQINPVEVSLKTSAAMRELMRRRGADMRIGRLLADKFRSRGLTGVHAEGRLFMSLDGSLFARFQRLTFEQAREPLLELGLVTAQELERDMAALDKDYAAPSPILWSVAGRQRE